MGGGFFRLKLEQTERVIDANDLSVLGLLVRAERTGSAPLGKFLATQ